MESATLSFLSLTGKVLKAINRIQNAPNEIQTMKLEMETFSSLFDFFRCLDKKEEDQNFCLIFPKERAQCAVGIKAQIQNLEIEREKLMKCLERMKADDHAFKQYVGKIRWLMDRDAMRPFVALLNDTKLSLNVYMTMALFGDKMERLEQRRSWNSDEISQVQDILNYQARLQYEMEESRKRTLALFQDPAQQQAVATAMANFRGALQPAEARFDSRIRDGEQKRGIRFDHSSYVTKLKRQTTRRSSRRQRRRYSQRQRPGPSQQQPPPSDVRRSSARASNGRGSQSIRNLSTQATVGRNPSNRAPRSSVPLSPPEDDDDLYSSPKRQQPPITGPSQPVTRPAPSRTRIPSPQSQHPILPAAPQPPIARGRPAAPATILPTARPEPSTTREQAPRSPQSSHTSSESETTTSSRQGSASSIDRTMVPMPPFGHRDSSMPRPKKGKARDKGTTGGTGKENELGARKKRRGSTTYGRKVVDNGQDPVHETEGHWKAHSSDESNHSADEGGEH